MVIVDGKHEVSWKPISPKEILSYVAVLLLESLQKHSSISCSLKSNHFLSRDRCTQIRNSITFPDIESPYETLIDNYIRISEDFDTPTIVVPDESLWKTIFTEFLTGHMEQVSLSYLFEKMQNCKIRLDPEGLSLYKIARKSLRFSDSLLLFSILLVVNASKHSCMKTMNYYDFCLEVVRGIYWFVTIPVSQVLLSDVHFLEPYKQCKSGPLRKQCYSCSRFGSIHKRTRFVCNKCEKAFCHSEECFVTYHRKNALPYYSFVLLVCS